MGFNSGFKGLIKSCGKVIGSFKYSRRESTFYGGVCWREWMQSFAPVEV